MTEEFINKYSELEKKLETDFRNDLSRLDKETNYIVEVRFEHLADGSMYRLQVFVYVGEKKFENKVFDLPLSLHYVNGKLLQLPEFPERTPSLNLVDANTFYMNDIYASIFNNVFLNQYSNLKQILNKYRDDVLGNR
jgi:hypothetical protein